jgi:hypothetical protein
MEQPSVSNEEFELIKEEGQVRLLRMFKDNTFQPVSIQEATIDFLPYFLEQCNKKCFTPKWIPQKHIERFQLGLQELKNHRNSTFIAKSNKKKLNHLREKALERANTYFTKASKPFKKICYIRCPNNNESYWQSRTMYFTPALYAHAYTAMAFTEYNVAHESLIKAITIDHSYIVGGMSIELLMVLAFTFKYERSQRYIQEHTLVSQLKQHLSAKQQMIDQAKTHGMAAANILTKIKKHQEIEEKQNNQRTVKRISKKLESQGFSILTVQSPEHKTFVIATPTDQSKPLTGKQRRAEKRKGQQQINNKK